MEEVKDSYKSISKHSEGLYKEKGSKFLAFAYPVENEEDIKKHIQALKKKYYDARHHVYAWKLGISDQNYRASDDGEPANSSGPPVLGQIRSYELSDILIVVVRYFGGTKLGVAGLINAYKTAAKEAIENNQIIEKIITKKYRISFVYPDMNLVMRKLKEHLFEPKNMIFENECTLDIDVRLQDCERVENMYKDSPQITIKQL